MTGYATTADVLRNLDSSSEQIDGVLLSFLQTVERRVDRLLEADEYPYFAPAVGQKDIILATYQDWVRFFTQPILVQMPYNGLTSFTVGGTDFTSSLTALPPWKLYIKDDSALVRYLRSKRSYDLTTVSVTATWGYTKRAQWGATTTLASGAAATGTVEVASVDSIHENALLRIDDEYLLVTDASSTTVTATRGVNGTTAATHTSGATVDVWKPTPDIQQEVARQAAMLYKRRAAFEQKTMDGFGQVASYPADLLTSLRNTVNNYKPAAPVITEL